MATFTKLPGVEAKRAQAVALGFDPGLPLENEHWPDPVHGQQKFERGEFRILRHAAPGGGDLFEVDYFPDTEELVRYLKAHFTPA